MSQARGWRGRIDDPDRKRLLERVYDALYVNDLASMSVRTERDPSGNIRPFPVGGRFHRRSAAERMKAVPAVEDIARDAVRAERDSARDIPSVPVGGSRYRRGAS